VALEPAALLSSISADVSQSSSATGVVGPSAPAGPAVVRRPLPPVEVVPPLVTAVVDSAVAFDSEFDSDAEVEGSAVAFQAGPAVVERIALIEAGVEAEAEALLEGVGPSSSSGSTTEVVSPSNPWSAAVARGGGVECAGAFASTRVSGPVVDRSLLLVDELAVVGSESLEVV